MAKMTKAQIEAARRRVEAALHEAQTSMPGSVVGADPDLEYRIIDLTMGEGRVIAARDRLERQGWILLDDPSPKVIGLGKAEVYALPREVYMDTIFAAQKQKDDEARAKIRGRKVRFL